MAQALNKVAERIPGLVTCKYNKITKNQHPLSYFYFIIAVVNFSRPRLATTWRYVKVEFKPPMPSEIPEVSNRISHILNSARSGKFANLTVKVNINPRLLL